MGTGLQGGPGNVATGKTSERQGEGWSRHISLLPDVTGDYMIRFPRVETSFIPGIKVVFQYIAAFSLLWVLVGIFHKWGGQKFVLSSSCLDLASE